VAALGMVGRHYSEQNPFNTHNPLDRAADPQTAIRSSQSVRVAHLSSEKNAALNKAFADAHAELVTSYVKNSYLGRLWAIKPRPKPSVMVANSSMAVGVDWHLLANSARRYATELAKENGQEIGVFLVSKSPNAPEGDAGQAVAKKLKASAKTLSSDAADLLFLLTLDALGMHDEAAESALRMIGHGIVTDDSKRHNHVLLKVSFCTEATRTAAVKLLIPEYMSYVEYKLGKGQRKTENWELVDVVRFLAVAGNQETVGQLSTAAKWAEEKEQIAWKRNFELTSNRISSRLALPPEKRLQRTQDELLYWQTEAGAPRFAGRSFGYNVAAARLIENGCRISPSYLIEKVDEIEGLSPEQLSSYNGSRSILDSPVIDIIIVQKQEAAIPAMLKLVERRPDWRDYVRDALNQIGTQKAKEAIRSLSNQSSEKAK
jgi:hypothetical protein